MKDYLKNLPTDYDPKTGLLTRGQAKFLGIVIALMTLGVVALAIAN